MNEHAILVDTEDIAIGTTEDRPPAGGGVRHSGRGAVSGPTRRTARGAAQQRSTLRIHRRCVRVRCRDLECVLDLYGGNVTDLEMSMSQMFALRPFAGMAGYPTHLRGLFLSCASTLPGGGIMGASGRNAARVALRHLERRWWRRRLS
jgi:phytoene dehydrogenase-like protein